MLLNKVFGLKGLIRVDLLPYNRAAGGKYKACGIDFTPAYDEHSPVNANTGAFDARDIPVKIA